MCERYIGAETQSTCNIWFSKQPLGSAKKRSLLAKRENGQSPGKRLTHLARRRKTFSSANLQGLGLSEKRQLVVQIKYVYLNKNIIICEKLNFLNLYFCNIGNQRTKRERAHVVKVHEVKVQGVRVLGVKVRGVRRRRE